MAQETNSQPVDETTEQTVTIAEPSASSTRARRKKAPAKKKAVAKKKAATKKAPTKKAPAKKKAVAKKEEKKEPKIPDIPGITSIRIKNQIVKALKENKRLQAVQLYRMAGSFGLADSVKSIDSYWRTVQLSLIDRSSYPKQSCINCIGACGQLKKLIQEHGPKLWDVRTNKAVACSDQFLTEDTLRKDFDSNLTLSFTNPRRYHEVHGIIQVFSKKIVRISYPRNGSKDINKIFQDEDTSIMNEIKSLLDEGFALSKTREKTCSDIRYKGIDPNDDEQDWKTYCARVDKEVAKIRVDTQKQFQEMSDEDACKILEEKFKSNGLTSILESYEGDVSRMCADFFPDKTLQQVASNAATHLMV